MSSTQNGGGPKSGTADNGTEHRKRAFHEAVAGSAAKRVSGQRIPQELLHYQQGMEGQNASANQRIADNRARQSQAPQSTRPQNNSAAGPSSKELAALVKSRADQMTNRRELHNVNQASPSPSKGNSGR